MFSLKFFKIVFFKEESIGILPRSLDVIFNSLVNRVDKCVFKPDGRNGFLVRDEFESAIARRRLELERADNGVELANRYVERRRVIIDNINTF